MTGDGFMQGPGFVTDWTAELLDKRWEELREAYPGAFKPDDDKDDGKNGTGW